VLLKSELLSSIGIFGFVVVYIGEEAQTKHVKFSKFKCYYLYVGEGKQCNAEKYRFTLTITQLCT